MDALHADHPLDRSRRAARGLMLLAAVVLLHGWLIDRLGRRETAAAVQGVAGARALPLQARVVAQVVPATPARRAADAGPERPAPAAVRMPVPVPVPLAPRGPVEPVAAAAPSAPAEPASPAAPAAPPAPAATDGAGSAVLAAPTGAAGEPPPRYATRVPAPALLRYALSYNGQAGEAMLSWQTDGQRYRLALDGRGSGAAPDGGRDPPALVEQLSRGGFDDAGLAPDRFVDRRRGRGWQAANFERGAGRISFSGPAVHYPAWSGAQDRLGWIVQMAAIFNAATEPLREVSLFVVTARGGGELWRFTSLGAEPLRTPLGTLDTLHLRREAPVPESVQVDVWLDPARGHWPAALRFTAPRRNDVFELRLSAEPAQQPQPPPT